MALAGAACAPAAGAPTWTYTPVGQATAVKPTAAPADQPPDAPSAQDTTSISVLPDLTPVADLVAAPADEQHASYAPLVSAPINRDYQAQYEIKLEVIENVCTIDADKGVRVSMWGYRIAGDQRSPAGRPDRSSAAASATW